MYENKILKQNYLLHFISVYIENDSVTDRNMAITQD